MAVSESELTGSMHYTLEKKSEHPLAKAITGRVESEVEQSEREKLTEVSDFQAVPGNGLSGKHRWCRSSWRKLELISDSIPKYQKK